MSNAEKKPSIKRFYKQAGITEQEGLWLVQLDGRSIRTPRGAVLAVPSKSVAEAIAKEWDAQGDEVEPDSMACMQITSAALDYVAPNRAEVEEELLRYADTDVLFYREATGALAERQITDWDPVLGWAKEYYGITPKITMGVMPVAQDPALFDRLQKVLQAKHEIELAVVWMMTKHLASLLLALSVAENQLTADDAFTRSRIEELVQNERWGEDEEAVARRRAAQDDMRRLADYYRLLSVK